MDSECSSFNPIPSPKPKSSALGSKCPGCNAKSGSRPQYWRLLTGARQKSHFSLLAQCVHLSISGKMFFIRSFVLPPFLLLLLCLLLAPTSPSPTPCRPSSPSQQCQFGEYEDPRCGRLCYKVSKNHNVNMLITPES